MKTFKVSGHITAEEHAALMQVAVTTGRRSTAIVAYGVKLALKKLKTNPRTLERIERDGRFRATA